MPPDSPPAGLARLKRQSASSPAHAWKPWALTGLMLTLFALVVLQLFGDRLRPGVEVETARVLVLPYETTDGAPPAAGPAEILFQSSGWIEADPWYTRVPALADGIVEEVTFQSGDLVSKGQVLVRMIPDDLDLEAERLQQELEQARRDLAAHKAAVDVAEQQVNAARAGREATIAALAEARDNRDRVVLLVEKDVLTEAERVTAEQQFLQHRARHREAESQVELAVSALDQVRAAVEVRESAVKVAQARLATVELNRGRLEIRSPIDGRVQERLVEPGTKRMRAMDDPHSATVALLYDPDKLQVRVDVPLSEAGKLNLEQPATVTTALLPGQEFQGVVTRIVGRADLQRNTLQAKVRVLNPHPRMRPDVLCRVAFHTAPEDGISSTASSSGGDALWIPADLAGDSVREAEVWVVDPLDQTAESRLITLGNKLHDGYRRVIEGVRPNELIVTHSARPLKPGDRITVTNPTSDP